MENAGVENLNLYEWTGGNPFYITEALANDSEVVPSSIKEALVARTSKLSLEGGCCNLWKNHWTSVFQRHF